MKFLQSCLCARKHRQSIFLHCGGPVKLVQAWRRTKQTSRMQSRQESSFHHLGGAVILVPPFLSAMKGRAEKHSGLTQNEIVEIA